MMALCLSPTLADPSLSQSTVSINQLDMIYTNQRIEGFVCSPWLMGTSPAFLAEMKSFLDSHGLVITETVFEGIASWPEAFASLFTGKNNGKVVVKV
jgi:NADPH-dependent curcumin reductase CurA